MEIIISNSSGIPIYEQIKEQIKTKIISKELNAGDMLPSIRSLAKDLRCSVITTKNAYEELEKEGYVETVPSKGVYVAEMNPEIVREINLQHIQNLMDSAVLIAKQNKIEKQVLIETLDILFEEEK